MLNIKKIHTLYLDKHVYLINNNKSLTAPLLYKRIDMHYTGCSKKRKVKGS